MINMIDYLPIYITMKGLCQSEISEDPKNFLFMKYFCWVLVENIFISSLLAAAEEQRSRWELERKMKSFSTSSSGGREGREGRGGEL